jgi:DNA-binding NtrC family response regulator/tetratricopeptide (TPR) repeat protein
VPRSSARDIVQLRVTRPVGSRAIRQRIGEKSPAPGREGPGYLETESAVSATGNWKLLGRSAAIRSIRDDLDRVVPRLALGRRVPPILLQGETGTGKGLLARTIHEASPRAGGPFVDLNCAAIPATLIEAELFGSERGAFTDARQSRTGLVQAAHTGTLFLDEIGLLSEGLQAKLLTVLESREVRPLGGTRARPVDVLIVAASNSDLRDAVRERRFREDLYHRLAVLVFAMPPLRERGDDVLELADAFLARACADHALSPKRLAADARIAIAGYQWPGNVRELANLMDRMALLTEGEVIAAADLDLPTGPGPDAPLRASVDRFTRERMEWALRDSHGNISAAADRLGVARSTFRYQLERLGLAPDRAGRSTPRIVPAPPLAERILAPPGTVAAERKQVTVLFADLKDVLERLAGHDPEATRKLIDPILERMIEVIRRHGGTVNQVRGDGIMALFGAPLALEDHAVRACYAALAMHEAVGIHDGDLRRLLGRGVRVRVGVHSGDVVLRSIGGEARLDYGAVPETTQVAAEMEQAAVPGTSRISAATRQLADGFVEVESTAPSPGFELRAPSGARSRLHASITRGLTHFVGRDAETMQIRAALDCARDRRGQLVALVGEPGVGKSRLTWEVTRAARSEGWLVLQTGSTSTSTAPPYLPLADLLREYFEIEPGAESERIRERVAGKLGELDEGLRPLAAPLLAILDVPGNDADWEGRDGRERRRRMLDGARLLILAASRGAPVLVVVDDLQWIDSETHAFLDLLVESLPAARVLLLVNYRPEGEHGWSGKSYYTQIRVDPLPAAGAGELLDALLGPEPVLDGLKRLLVERTAGNPFFLEEIVWALVETRALVGERGAYRLLTPLVSVEVPATVQAVLAARIDRLPPEGKGLLHAASAIGMDVPLALLQSIADLPDEAVRRGLEHLLAGEFLYETGLWPNLEYTFKHALTHDVAYGSLLPEHRRALHARIVEAIERLNPGRLDEHIDRLAHHALQGEVWDRAVDFLGRAAEAVTRVAYADAAAYYERALAALRRLPEDLGRREQAADLHFELARCLYSTGHFDRATAAYRDAERVAAALGDDDRVARVCTGLAYLLGSEADHHGAIEAGERALVLAKRVADLELQTWTSVGLAREHFAVGDYRRGIERARSALDASMPTTTRFRNLPTPVGSRTWLALCLASTGQFVEALTWAEAALALADRAGSFLAQVWASYTLGRIHSVRGHFAPALTALERAAALLERGAFPIYAPRVLASLGAVYAVEGRAKDGLALLERAAAEGEAGRILFDHAMVLTQLGEAHLDGRPDEAERRATQAIELARGHGEKANEAWALHLLGRVAAARPSDAMDAALAHTSRAMALATELGMRPLVAHCLLELGRRCRRTGKIPEAREHLATAIAMYREMDMRVWPDRALAELGDPAARPGRPA